MSEGTGLSEGLSHGVVLLWDGSSAGRAVLGRQRPLGTGGHRRGSRGKTSVS